MTPDGPDRRRVHPTGHRGRRRRAPTRNAAAHLPALLIATAPLVPEVAALQTPEGGRTMEGISLPVEELVLANGMRFLLLERPGAPTVSFVVHVGVGSIHDPPGQTGISHFLEHLLFKGTTTIGTTDLESERIHMDAMDTVHDSIVQEGAMPSAGPRLVERLQARLEALEDSARAYVIPNEYDRILTSHGARGPNATTSYEETTYYVSLPSNRAKLWFVLESDRMRSPVFREFHTERRVIMEERRLRTETSAPGLLSAAYHGAAFTDHPYGVPPIGYRADLLRLSRREVEAHHRRYYGPGQTTVAIVGHFEADSAAVWAERYFGALEPRGSAPPAPPPEVVQREPRRVEIRYDAGPAIRIGWKVPPGLAPESPVLQVLANLLVGSRDARLHRRLVSDERIAASVFAGTGPGRLHPGLFTIQAIPVEPHAPEDVEAAIYDELERLRRVPPTDGELGRVRTALLAAEVRRLASSEGLAFQLASSQAAWGDWRETFRLQERMRAVGRDEIARVLDDYFRPEGRTVAILRPAEEP